MDDFYDYVVAEFQSGVRLCKAPFASLIKDGDLIEAKGVYGKGKVLAAETSSKSNNMLKLLDTINYPEKEAYKISAIYSKKEIDWKEDEQNG